MEKDILRDARSGYVGLMRAGRRNIVRCEVLLYEMRGSRIRKEAQAALTSSAIQVRPLLTKRLSGASARRVCCLCQRHAFSEAVKK